MSYAELSPTDKRVADMIVYMVEQRSGVKGIINEFDIKWALNTLFIADRKAYVELGQSITGTTWSKGNTSFPDDPVPSNLGAILEAVKAV